LGRRDHSPAHLHGLGAAGELVFDHHPAVRLQREAAAGAGHLPGVNRAQVHHGIRVFRVSRKGRDGRRVGDDLVRVVNEQRAMPAVVVAEEGPAIGAGLEIPEPNAALFQGVIVLRAQVHRPAHAVGIQHKRANIQVRVAGRRRAGLDGQKHRVAVRPGTAEYRQRVLALSQPVSGGRLPGFHPGFGPQQHQRKVAPARLAAMAAPDGRQLLLQQLVFKPQQFRPFRARRKPHHGRRKAGARAAVAEIKGPPRGADDVQHELARLEKARAAAEAEIGAEHRFKHREEHDVETRAVVPIARAFGIYPIRDIRFQGIRQAGKSAVDDFRRLVGMIFQQRQGAGHHPGMANLVPVVPPVLPAPPGFGFEIRSQSLLLDRRAAGLPQLGSQLVEQPVIAHGEGQRHFRRIQKMGRVPIRHVRHGLHFGQRPVRIALVAGQAEGKPQVHDAV